MYINQKMVGAAFRNPFGVRADKLAVCVPFTEGSGVPDDQGTFSIDDPTNWGTNAVTGSATWAATDGGCLQFTRGAAANYLAIGNTARATDIDLDRCTIEMVFTMEDVTTITQYLMATATLVSVVDNSLSVSLRSANTLTVQHHTAVSASAPAYTFTVATGTKYVLVIKKTAAGWWAYLNGTLGTAVNSPSTDNTAFRIPATRGIVLGSRNAGLATNGASATFYAFNLWAWALSDDDLNDLYSDIYQSSRREVADGYLDTPTGPLCHRVTQFTADFGWVTTEAMTAAIKLRVVYGATTIIADSPTVSVVTTATTSDAKASVQLSGLLAGTAYYYLSQWSLDGGLTWYNFPHGRGRFVTQRDSGAFKWAGYGDDHLLSPVVADLLAAGNIGFGDDCKRLTDQYAAHGPDSGTLTTRLSATAGELTMDEADHSVTSGATIDLEWDGGSATGATVGSVSGTTVPFSGASGDALPTDTPPTAISVQVRPRPGYLAGTARTCYKIWRMLQDMVAQGVDFIICGGDSVVAGDSADPRSTFMGWRRLNTLLLTKVGCFFNLIGNHDGERSYYDQVASGRERAQGILTDLRKKFIPGPTSLTYSEGGENEGLPAEPLNSASADYASNVGWLRDLAHGADGNPKTWFDTYIYPFPAAANHAAKMGGNTSPLENYYAFTWSNALFVALDPFRYTNPGQNWGAGGSGRFLSEGAPWVLGERQKTWLQDVLSNSTATHKFVLCHQFFGGFKNLDETWYGRGSGLQCRASRVADWESGGINASEHAAGDPLGDGVIEETWLHQQLRAAGVTAFIKWHDHCFSHAISETVNYVSLSSFSPAIDPADYVAAFGSQYTLGGAVADGYQTQHYSYLTGYGLFSIAPTAADFSVRHTAHEIEVDWTAYSSFARAYVGAVIAAAAGATTLTLPSTPWEVVAVFDEDDGDFAAHEATTLAAGASWATYNHYAQEFSGSGTSFYDQPYTSGALSWTTPLDAAGGARVSYVPRSLYEVTLTNASHWNSTVQQRGFALGLGLGI